MSDLYVRLLCTLERECGIKVIVGEHTDTECITIRLLCALERECGIKVIAGEHVDTECLYKKKLWSKHETVANNLIRHLVFNGCRAMKSTDETFKALLKNHAKVGLTHLYPLSYWAIQRSWFARVNVLCNLSCKKS